MPKYVLHVEVELKDPLYCDGCQFCPDDEYRCSYTGARTKANLERGQQIRPDWCPLEEVEDANK